MGRYIIIIILTFFVLHVGHTQGMKQLSLVDAYHMLEGRYPALQDGLLLDEIYRAELQQLDIDKRPSIVLHGEGRLQSERLKLEGGSLPFSIEQPLVNIKSYVEAQYILIDGGANDARRTLKEVELSANHQLIEVQKFNLRKRIDVLFLNIELVREQIKIYDFSINDIEARKERVSAGIEHGIILESELTKLAVKELEITSAKDDAVWRLSGLINTLSDLVGTSIDHEVDLVLPELRMVDTIRELDRPEQKLFDLQKDVILAKSVLIDVDNKPKLSAFAQAGVGYPNALNFFDTSVAPYGVVGAKLVWKLTDWDKGKVQKILLNLQSQKLDNAKATFEFNLNSKNAQYLSEVERIKNQVANDNKIATLQAEILTQLGTQLDEGIITSSDYVIQVNAELRARQNLIIHQKQLQKVQLEFWSERGGY